MSEFERPELIYVLVAKHLRRDIISGTWKEGERVPSNAKLGKRFEVDGKTVHKAFKLLAKEGLVRTEAKSGTFVQPRSEWRLSD